MLYELSSVDVASLSYTHPYDVSDGKADFNVPNQTAADSHRRINANPFPASPNFK